MENNSEERLAYLAEKWLLGKITTEEAEEYAAWYNQEDQSTLDIPEVFAKSKHQQENRIWASLLRRIRNNNSHKITFGKWYKVAAIITLLFLVGGGIFWLISLQYLKMNIAHVDINHAGNDIFPGRSGAVLTLANGQQIHLDSSGNGILAQQGSVAITHSNGNLIYTNKTKQQSSLFNTLSTARGQQFPLTLSDGTKVWLNAESSIHFPVVFREDERLVEITGEAYFEVAHNNHKPFLVHRTGANTTVRVLGTHFNVNSYPNENNTVITLLEGSVRVSKGSAVKLLHPGWQADITNDRDNIQLGKADIESVMAWKNGFFSFDNTDLTTVMRQLARWYDIDVIYKNGHAPTMTFWGDISRNSNLSQVLKVLEESNVKFEIEGRKLIVY